MEYGFQLVWENFLAGNPPQHVEIPDRGPLMESIGFASECNNSKTCTNSSTKKNKKISNNKRKKKSTRSYSMKSKKRK